jgi:hypothetical protein
MHWVSGIEVRTARIEDSGIGNNSTQCRTDGGFVLIIEDVQKYAWWRCTHNRRRTEVRMVEVFS